MPHSAHLSSIVVALCVLAACRDVSSSGQSNEARELLTSVPSVAAGRAARERLASHTTLPAPALPALPSDGSQGRDGVLDCGQAKCRLPGEVCCYGDSRIPDRCLRRPPEGDGIGMLVRLCGPDQAAAVCDDSNDCPATTICSRPKSGERVRVCLSPSDAADFEDCHGEDTCRTPETRCYMTEWGGSCERFGQIRCGALTCQGPSELCEANEGFSISRCGRLEAVPLAGSSPYRCTSPADCGSAMKCCGARTGSRGTSCRFDCGTDEMMCLSDADCVEQQRKGDAGRAGCLARKGTAGKLRFCQPQ